MRKKLVNQKRDNLRQLSRQELVDHITDYPGQDFLNQTIDGEKRSYPVGHMANNIKANDYEMTDSQYYTLIHHFAAITTPELRVVGITFRENDAESYRKTLVSQSKNGAIKTYEVDYILYPEPENPYDPNAVKVLIGDNDGTVHQVGYIAKDIVAEFPIKDPMLVEGTITDFSNDHWSNVSYRLHLDLEKLTEAKDKYESSDYDAEDDGLSLTDDDLAFADDSSFATDPIENFIYDEYFNPTEKHVYETDLLFTEPPSQEQKDAFELFGATGSMLAYIHDKNWNDSSKTFHDVRECSFNLTSAEWDLDGGKVRIETIKPLPADQMEHLSNWIYDHAHRDVNFGKLPLQESDYKLTEVTTNECEISITDEDLLFIIDDESLSQ